MPESNTIKPHNRKLFVLGICLLMLNAPIVSANSSWENDIDAEFEAFNNKQKADFQRYQSEQNKAFLKLLESQWREFTVFQGIEPPIKPKPRTIPKVQAQIDMPVNKASLAAHVLPRIISEANKITPQNIRSTSTRIEPQGQPIEISYYGKKITLYYDESIKVALNGRPSQQSIQEFYHAINASNFTPLLHQIQDIKFNLRLSDWGYIQFTHQIAQQLFNNENEAKLFSTLLLNETNYDIRVAYEGDNIYQLASTRTKLFKVLYFSFDDTNYYLINLDGRKQSINKLYTYEANAPQSFHPVDFIVRQPPLLSENSKSKNLRFNYNGHDYELKVHFNRAIIDYFNSYPRTELSVYFSSVISQELNDSLLSALGEIIRDKNELEAANILLRFVQTAFEYKTDEEQFGYEKYFFSEELFQYKYSDCEDRSVLFSYLVKQLLNLDVAIVDYPDHVATAIRFTEKVEGANFLVNDGIYTLSDPTYMNADVGMVMPKYANIKASVTPL